MAMIRYGPAGIPLSCKGRTLKDGIEDVHNLALTALEIQMVRPKTYPRPPDEDEEVGKTIKELGPESEFVVAISREGEDLIYDPDEIIEETDDLVVMPAGVAACFNDLY
ncbi:MAG: endonuclease IV, partial [Candidatus Methanomethylophilus sp.]|nr:endonuclease IV [Methanomethylophilus sp.]